MKNLPTTKIKKGLTDAQLKILLQLVQSSAIDLSLIRDVLLDTLHESTTDERDMYRDNLEYYKRLKNTEIKSINPTETFTLNDKEQQIIKGLIVDYIKFNDIGIYDMSLDLANLCAKLDIKYVGA